MREIKSSELREKFLNFFKGKRHTIVPSSSLLPTDPSVLFTTAGMQQFKPYYLGEKSPWGKNVASVQKCIRTSDIEEVGDESHLTFFEMLGNFSFGGYGKKEAIEYAHEFITKELGLKIDYVTVFSPDKVEKGDWRKGVPEDKESFEIWNSLGVKKIKKEGIDNFWGPTGYEGPCGPTTEIYVNGVEIWNIVFNEFFCDKDRKLEKLETLGVDTGMGLERLAMVVQKAHTVFEADLFKPIMEKFPTRMREREKRIVADHIRGIAFLISDGVRPSNKGAGYVLRRLIRRVIVNQNLASKGTFSGNDIYSFDTTNLLALVVDNYGDFYKELNKKIVWTVFSEENSKYRYALNNGVREIKKYDSIDSKIAFKLFGSYGLTFEIIKDFAGGKAKDLKLEDFEQELKKHQELSRTASAGMFKGGLADEKPETIKLHTAHHLLLAALQELFGKQVKQKGSNINSERLRIDFSFERKLTDDEKKKIEDIVNDKIKQGFDVVRKEMPKEEAEKIGAEMEFGVKYSNTVSVYFIENKKGKVFSKEFCGGPHVKNTSELGKFKIIKEEAVSSGVRRIKAILE